MITTYPSIAGGGLTGTYPNPVLNAAFGWVSVNSYGATGNGTTDDYPAVQAAINAAAAAGGGIVFFPPGTYLCNTALIPATMVNYQGVGQSSIIKVNGTNNMFETPAAHAKQWWMRNLQLQATGGHVFNAVSGGWFEVVIEDCFIRQYSSTKAILNLTSLYDSVLVRNNDLYASGATRTIPAWNVQLSAGASAWYDHNYSTYGDFCSNQPFVLHECTINAGASTGNRYTANNFAGCDGGTLKLLSLFGTTIDGAWCNDNSVTPGLSGSVVYCGKSAATGALAMSKTFIRDVGRDKAPVAGTYEIYLESTCVNTLIESPRWVPDNGNIHLNGTDAILVGISAGTTITGDAGLVTQILGGTLKGAFAGTTVSATAITATSGLITPTTNSLTTFRVTNVAAGSEVFDVDTINKRVGIGTTAPAHALEVATGNIFVNAPGTGYVFLSRGANTNNAGFLFATGGAANLKWLVGMLGNSTEDWHLQDQISGVDVLTLPINKGTVGVGGISPTSVLHVNGPVATNIVAKTTTYTVTATDSTITCDASGGAFTVTLPTAVTCKGRQYVIKKTDVSANLVTVATTSAQTIDGVTTRTLASKSDTLVVQSDAANWQIVNRLTAVQWAPVTLTYAATVTTDASLGNHFRVTLTGALTLANPTNPTDGQRITWELIQDATGSRVLTLGAAFAFGTPDITAATLTTTANKRDFLEADYNSTAAKWFVVRFVRGY